MLSYVIDTMDNLNVSTTDMPGNLLQTNMEDTVLVQKYGILHGFSKLLTPKNKDKKSSLRE